nr:MAG TPA: hypothetical protein [Bacteriophage sp.]
MFYKQTIHYLYLHVNSKLNTLLKTFGWIWG